MAGVVRFGTNPCTCLTVCILMAFGGSEWTMTCLVTYYQREWNWTFVFDEPQRVVCRYVIDPTVRRLLLTVNLKRAVEVDSLPTKLAEKSNPGIFHFGLPCAICRHSLFVSSGS